MKAFLKKYQIWLFPGAFLIVLLGITLTWFGLRRSINVIVDGQARIIRSSALSVSGILRSAGLSIKNEDRVLTDSSDSIWGVKTVIVERAREVWIKTPDQEFALETTETIPANLLLEVDIVLYPNDQILINSLPIDAYSPIEMSGPILLQYKPAQVFTVKIDKQEQVIHTTETTLGAALEEEGIQLSMADWISHPLSTQVAGLDQVTIRRARLVTAAVDGQEISGFSAATTVGEALEDLGQPLQNLDASIPPADSSLPENREIQIVRVNEELMIMTDEIPYDNDWVEDPNAILDTISVVEPGQEGIYATRERIRYEDGEEVWRSPEESWQASQVQQGVLGYGTRVEVRTEVVDGVEIEYWRKITVYATAYSPCRSGVDRCLYGTATGIMPVQKGVVAVTNRWISVPNGYGMWGQSVYIPGYGRGVIADTGGGIPGTPWIDLAYSDDDYQSWNRWTTMYFLTPVPAWYPAVILP